MDENTIEYWKSRAESLESKIHELQDVIDTRQEYPKDQEVTLRTTESALLKFGAAVQNLMAFPDRGGLILYIQRHDLKEALAILYSEYLAFVNSIQRKN